MTDIYATPGAELSQPIDADRAGGNVEDALRGDFEIGMLQTLGEAWRSLGGFKLKFWIAVLLQVAAGFFIGLAFGVVIAILAQSGADRSALALFNFFFQLVITLFMLPMGIAVMVMAMRHANRCPVSASEIFRHFGVVAALAGAYLLVLILILLGLALLVLPGLYLAVAYFYALPLVLEKKMGIWRALETSRRAVTRVWFRMLGLLIVLWLVNLLGVVTLIGWIWTLPLSLLTLALVYQKIFGVEAHTLAE